MNWNITVVVEYRKAGKRIKNGPLNDWQKNIEIKSSNAEKTMKGTALK